MLYEYICLFQTSHRIKLLVVIQTHSGAKGRFLSIKLIYSHFILKRGALFEGMFRFQYAASVQ